MTDAAACIRSLVWAARAAIQAAARWCPPAVWAPSKVENAKAKSESSCMLLAALQASTWALATLSRASIADGSAG